MLQYNSIDYMKKVLGMVSGMDADKVFTVCILVVKEDLTCNYIVEEMLRPYFYQVLHTGGGLDVLKAIWESKERLHLVLTNANKLGSSGTEIVRHIRNTLGLPVLPLSSDKRKIGSKGQSFSFAAYMLSGLSINGLEKIWQMALKMEKDKMVASHPEENVQGAPIPDVAVETNKTSSSINDAACLNQKHKGVDLSEGSKKDHPKAKKPRVVWTIEMHQKFLKALDIIGYDKAVPKKIVEIMNVPGLTRENVASHLQKFRGSMKRTQETVFSSLYTRDELEGFRVLSSPPASRFSSSQTNAMTPCPQSSYISAAKESITSSECHYLNMHKDFSFGATLERKAHISIRGLSFRDQSGVDKLHKKHFNELHFTPNFRIYDVEKRNMLLSIDGISSSDVSHHQSYISKFVGYRVTSDGKSVAYGNTEAPTDTSFQGLSVSGIHGNETSFINMCGKFALHSSEGQRYENLDPSTPPSIAFEQHMSLQPFKHSGNEEDTEKCFSLVDQSNLQPANVAPSENPLEVDMLVQNTSAPSTMILHRDEGLPFPPLEFLDAILQQQYSSPSPLPQVLQYMDEIFDQSENEDPQLKGTGSSTSHQFDFEEFDDTLID